LVGSELVYELLRRGKFQVNILECDSLFSKKNEDLLPLTDNSESNVQTFSKLFLNKDSTEFKNQELGLDSFIIFDDYSALIHIDYILSMNAKNVKLDVNSMQNDKCFPLHDMPITLNIAKRTENIEFTYRVGDGGEFIILIESEFPIERWYKLIWYFLNTCPNLKCLTIRVYYNQIESELEHVLLCYSKAVNGIVKQLLPLFKDDLATKICIELTTYLDRYMLRELSINDYDLFKFGEVNNTQESAPNSDFETSRIYKQKNSIGVEHHLIFNIFDNDGDLRSDGNRSLIQELYDDTFGDYYDGDEDDGDAYDSNVDYDIDEDLSD